MKKILIALILMVGTSTVFAQKLVKDYVNDNGYRVILCSTVSCKNFTDNVLVSYGLSYLEKEEVGSYFLDLAITKESSYEIKPGYKLLMKNMDDEVIELECSKGDDVRTYEIEWIGNYASHKYNGYVSYAITKEQMTKMLSGIKKVRIQNSIDYFEINYKKDKIGNVIKEEYKIIKEALQKKPKDISSDF